MTLKQDHIVIWRSLQNSDWQKMPIELVVSVYEYVVNTWHWSKLHKDMDLIVQKDILNDPTKAENI